MLRDESEILTSWSCVLWWLSPITATRRYRHIYWKVDHIFILMHYEMNSQTKLTIFFAFLFSPHNTAIRVDLVFWFIVIRVCTNRITSHWGALEQAFLTWTGQHHLLHLRPALISRLWRISICSRQNDQRNTCSAMIKYSSL